MSQMPEPPPLDFDALAPPPEDFDTDYDPALDLAPFDEPPFDALPPVEPPDLPPGEPPAPPEVEGQDDGWAWHDARLIGIDRGPKAGEYRYEVGCIDLYSNPYTGDMGGSYLPIAAFAEQQRGAAFYYGLQAQIHDQRVPPYEIPDFAEENARLDAPEWHGASRHEYAAYDYIRAVEDHDPALADDLPEAALDPLLEEAFALGGVAVERTPEPDVEQPAFQPLASTQALAAIGIQAENFDPSVEPPPFYDEQTGTAYWIGVFQENVDDPDHCITSILSLGRNPDTDEIEAQLAPCVPGDWDKAYGAAEYLIHVAQKGGIERCFDVAEGMALATDQRAFWEAERGLLLDEATTQDISAYTAETWEVEL